MSVAVVVDVAENSLRLLLQAACFVHNRIQRLRPVLGRGLQTVPAWGVPTPHSGRRPCPEVPERIVVTAQRAAEGGPAAINALQGHVRAVQDRVTGGTVPRP